MFRSIVPSNLYDRAPDGGHAKKKNGGDARSVCAMIGRLPIPRCGGALGRRAKESCHLIHWMVIGDYVRDFEANLGFHGVARRCKCGSSLVALSITLSVVKCADRGTLCCGAQG
jgi:hypothetical protein